MTAIAALPKPRAPVNLDEALRTACEGLAGITPAQFRALLSPEDISGHRGRRHPPETLHAYAQSFAEGMRSGRIVVGEVGTTTPSGGQAEGDGPKHEPAEPTAEEGGAGDGWDICVFCNGNGCLNCGWDGPRRRGGPMNLHAATPASTLVQKGGPVITQPEDARAVRPWKRSA